MIDLSTALGLTVFVFSLAFAVALYVIDQYERVSYSMPFGPAIPYTIAVIGAGIFVYADMGVVAIAKALAGLVIFGAFSKGLSKLDTE